MKRTFKNLKTGKEANYEFNTDTGQVFFLNQWWDVDFLARNFSIVDATPKDLLGPQRSPGFREGVE